MRITSLVDPRTHLTTVASSELMATTEMISSIEYENTINSTEPTTIATITTPSVIMTNAVRVALSTGPKSTIISMEHNILRGSIITSTETPLKTIQTSFSIEPSTLAPVILELNIYLLSVPLSLQPEKTFT
jgi:hypothetical protein